MPSRAQPEAGANSLEKDDGWLQLPERTQLRARLYVSRQVGTVCLPRVRACAWVREVPA